MDPRITWTIAQMEQRLAEPMTVEDLARQVNLSASRFRHLFARDVGVSPARYLQGLRLGRARLLLERTFLTVKEVMGLVGVADPSHFSRDFQRAFGLTPTQAQRSRIRQHTRASANGWGAALPVRRR